MTARSFERFYTEAAVTEVEAGHAVVLDRRTVKTPQRRAALTLPTRPLAEAVAAEWDAQGDTVKPDEMPLTALAFTAYDVAEPQRDGLVEGLARYADTELVCYRAPEPAALARREHALWQPLLDWLALTYDARLNTTTGILPIEQPPEAKQALTAAIAELDAMRLAALSSSVRTAGSLVVALALLERRLDADQAFEAAEVERTFQIEQWGEDAEATRLRESLWRDLDGADRFLRLLER
jgi:chaperone required for assembly of F1-ATPase